MNADQLEHWLRRRGRWLALLLALAVGLPLLRRAGLDKRSHERGDTRFYRIGAARYLVGENLYYDRDTPVSPDGWVPTTGYTYLPPFAAFSAWMVPLPYRAVRVVWLLLMLACAAATLHLAVRLAGARGPPVWRPRLALVLLVPLVLRFGVNDLAHGQVNWLVCLLLVGCLLALERGRQVLAGVSLGLALAIKPTSWLLVPWFWLGAGRRRAAAWAAGSCAAWIAGTTLRYRREAPALIGDWLERMSGFAHEAAHAAGNVSASGALTHLFAGVSERQQEYVLLFSGDADLVRGRVHLGVTLAVGLVFALLLWRRRGSLRAAVAVLLLGALLSPVTWKAHLVVLALPGALVARHLAEGRASSWAWGAYLGLVALLNLPAQDLLGLEQLEAAGSLTAVLIALCGWLVWARLEESGEPG